MPARRIAIAAALAAAALPSAARADDLLVAATPLSHAPPTTHSGSSSQPARPELPRTGADAWLIGLSGTGLLLAGLGLRLRAPAGGG